MQKLRLVRGFVVLAMLATATTVMLAPSAQSAGSSGTFVVLYKTNSVPASAASKIQAAGGTLLYSYPQIGVAIATSGSSSFGTTLTASDSSVQGAVANADFGTQLRDLDGADSTASPAVPATPAPGSDNLSALQWDMDQIQAPAARPINGGSSSVTVGDIDTGLDFTHPDLAPNVDYANSVSCIGGTPNTAPSAWMDDNGHGTHTAGTIAAAKNTIGIVGVAPNVKVAGIKAGNAAGFFFPAEVVCSFMWVGTHHIPVTNNSYFADPWLFNCKNDPGQRAIWEAERRAIKFAQQNGDVVVAAEGNQADDLAHPTQDVTSPDDTTPVTRAVSNACAVVPVEVPGVVGVTADGNKQIKSFYSSYGVGTADVTAPGGDSILQVTAAAVNGRVLSTWPASLIGNCLPSRQVFDGAATYCYAQGTSMASPHVAGVAALIFSVGAPSSSTVLSKLQATTDAFACPDTSVYSFFPAVDNGAPQTCQGGTGSNGFYGKGQVNALRAVS